MLTKGAAAIHQAFPESALLKRLKVLQSKEAAAFFTEWPAARETLDANSQAVNKLGSAFRESATQSAFVSLAARHTSLETTLRSHSQKLDVLTRRTEPLSPSHQQASTSQSRTRTPESTHLTPPPPCLCGIACTLHASPVHSPQRPTIQLLPPATTKESTNTTPPSPVPVLPVGCIPASNTNILSPPAHPEILSLASVVHNGETFSVLRLSPGPSPPYTAFDMILPEPSAFCDPMSMTINHYPEFTSRKCNWTSMFAMIQQPALLWKPWRPDNLGNYQSIRLLWQAWDEGTLIEGVGRKPPLRLVDKEWGSQKHQQTSKGRLPSWRPHQNASVSALEIP